MVQKHTIPLLDISEKGLAITVEDQDLWRSGILEFSIPCTIAKPLIAKLSIIKTHEGCVVRGDLTGSVLLPCDRCAEETSIEIAWQFDDFEPNPGLPDASGGVLETRIVHEGGIDALDIGALLWEEFLLALPEKPLCSETCKGLCPHCGQNLNTGPCACQKDEGDPRLAVFRTMRHS
ncbi:MAG: DUF177 domain-containing protein [Desulfovibrionaceae bacterium]|nr:DUF177 domain-containing protein [Desulfovibrionaceae bacterium]